MNFLSVALQGACAFTHLPPWWMSLADPLTTQPSLLRQHCCLPQTLLPLNPPLHTQPLSWLQNWPWLQCCLRFFLKIQPNPSFTDCGLSHTMDCLRCFQPTCTLISVERVKQEQDRFPFKAYLNWFFFNRWNVRACTCAHTHTKLAASDHMEKSPLISSINVLQFSTSTVEQKTGL